MRTYAAKVGIPEGFNVARIRSLRRRAAVSKAARLLACCALLSPLMYGALDFLARAPRERLMARSSFTARVINGVKINSALVWNWLTAEHDDPKSTKMPVYELFLRRQKLQALSEHLPQSGRIFQPGAFKARQSNARDVVLPALLRFRGDSLNHWSFPQKSWRVKLKHHARYLGARQFNLYLPRSRSQIPDFLGYQLAERMGGLIVPKAFPIHLRVNRQFSGLRVFLEQIDGDFLANRGVKADRLFVGDIDSRALYNISERHRLFEDTLGWEVETLSAPNDAGSSDPKAPMAGVISALDLAATDPERFRETIESLIDIPGLLRYMAYLELVASVHVDETHNQRFFFDTELKKLRPIVWDPVAYYWDSREVLRGIDFGKSRLFREVLRIPAYREEKNRYLWEAINGPLSSDAIVELIDQGARAIRHEVMASAQGIFTDSATIGVLPHSAWSAAVQDLRERSKERNNFLRRALEKSSVAACVEQAGSSAKLRLEVGGDAGVQGESIVIVTDARVAADATFNIKGSSGVEQRVNLPFHPEIGGYEVPFQDFLSSTRTYDRFDNPLRRSTTYIYEVQSTGIDFTIKTIRARNSITDQPLSFNVQEGECN